VTFICTFIVLFDSFLFIPVDGDLRLFFFVSFLVWLFGYVSSFDEFGEVELLSFSEHGTKSISELVFKTEIIILLFIGRLVFA